MSLELFGYHHADGDDAAAAALPQLAFGDNFKGGCDYYGWGAPYSSASGGSGSGSSSSSSSSSSVLSFDHAGGGAQHLAYSAAAGDDECALWMVDAAAGMVDHQQRQHGAAKFGFVDDGLQIQETNSAKPPAKASQKRDCPGGEAQGARKKQCGGGGKKSNGKAAPPTAKDPQGVAAKVRRERISERLKVLQDLVPNGTKVDLVTMLEKAISYVKFLQLQVKVLATDEFWPAQGGKAPELSQVKDALDAILSSQAPSFLINK